MATATHGDPKSGFSDLLGPTTLSGPQRHTPLASVMCSKNFCPFIYLFLVTLNSF